MEWLFVFKIPLNGFAIYADSTFEQHCFPFVPLIENSTKTRRASTLFQKMISLKVLSGLGGSCRVGLSNKKRERRIYDEARSRIDILVETSYRFNVVKAKNF